MHAVTQNTRLPPCVTFIRELQLIVHAPVPQPYNYFCYHTRSILDIRAPHDVEQMLVRMRELLKTATNMRNAQYQFSTLLHMYNRELLETV